MNIKVTPISEEYNFDVELIDPINNDTIKGIAILKVQNDEIFFQVISQSQVSIPRETISQIEDFVMNTYFPGTQNNGPDNQVVI